MNAFSYLSLSFSLSNRYCVDWLWWKMLVLFTVIWSQKIFSYARGGWLLTMSLAENCVKIMLMLIEYCALKLIGWSQQKSKLSTLDLPVWKIELFTPTFRSGWCLLINFLFIFIMLCRYSYVRFFCFFCRVDTIGLLKFFSAISILLNETPRSCLSYLWSLLGINFSCYNYVSSFPVYSCAFFALLIHSLTYQK